MSNKGGSVSNNILGHCHFMAITQSDFFNRQADGGLISEETGQSPDFVMLYYCH